MDAIKSGHSLPPLTHPQGGAVGALISSLVDLWEKQRNTLRQISEFKAKDMEYIEASMMDSTRVKEATEKEK
ncbi:MAG TPA: hypothetical protein VIU33_04530, partial [Nitrospiria bacterium]